MLLIKEIIREDIQRFVDQEGFYSIVKFFTAPNSSGAYPNEDHIQKVLSVQLENALLKRGLRGTDIYREPQLMDNKRPDFVIKYGFVKPIVVEIKLLKNPEVTDLKARTNYKEKLQQYIHSQNAEYGIYLIFKVKEEDNDKHFYDLRKEYQDIKDLYIPDFIDCTVNTINR